MLKFLVIAVLLWIVLRPFFRGLFVVTPRSPRRAEPGHDARGSVGKLEVLNACPTCGTYFSDKQKIVRDGRAYCSVDCAR